MASASKWTARGRRSLESMPIERHPDNMPGRLTFRTPERVQGYPPRGTGRESATVTAVFASRCCGYRKAADKTVLSTWVVEATLLQIPAAPDSSSVPMTAETLQALYADELTRMLGWNGGVRLNRRNTRWMRAKTWSPPGQRTGQASRRGPGWSDLHGQEPERSNPRRRGDRARAAGREPAPRAPAMNTRRSARKRVPRPHSAGPVACGSGVHVHVPAPAGCCTPRASAARSRPGAR